MLVSVIIPTYNRPNLVMRLLDCLINQSLSPQSFEVIVVDDGSDCDYKEFINIKRPYNLTFLCQTNQGATIARNNGALQSQGEVLIFIDDDVTISQHTLETLYEACNNNDKILVTGRLIQNSSKDNSLFARLINNSMGTNDIAIGCEPCDEYLPISYCNTQLLAVRRIDFIRLGMMQDPKSCHYWDDVEFGYRAYKAGFKLLKCCNVHGIHWDHNLDNLNITCLRWYKASKAAVDLFERHHDAQLLLPMFYDKTPIDWRNDPSSLIVRKMARQISANKASIILMEFIVKLLESIYPKPIILYRFYRWIQGGYIFRGYTEGLREAKKSDMINESKGVVSL
jgi:glycosyltransferase involved in cell wall biosynthesis